MKKIRRKQAHCLNCDYSFTDSEIRYCPKCGQENSDKRVSFGTLIMDFLGDYFTFDSRLFRSVGRLLISPGYLSLAFNEGKRVPYIPPLRMFLLTGVIFFTILSYQYNHLSLGNFIANGEEISLSEISEENIVEAIKSDAIKEVELKLVTETDEARRKELLESIDSIKQYGINEMENDTNSTSMQLGKDSINFNFGKFLRWSKELEPELVADSLKIKAPIFRRLAIQSAKVVKNSGGSLVSYFLGQLSIMVLIMVPIVALLLKILYVRHREFFYVDHLVFTFHIHSFLYVMLAVFLLAAIWIPVNSLKILFLLALVYIFFALKNVYKQKIGKTFMKFFVMGILYLICSLVFILLTFGFSFLMF